MLKSLELIYILRSSFKNSASSSKRAFEIVADVYFFRRAE